MSHPGQGLPPELIQDMVGGGQQWTSQQGLTLNLSRRLLNKLNGNIRYVREQAKCYFLIDLELKLKRSRGSVEATTSQRTWVSFLDLMHISMGRIEKIVLSLNNAEIRQSTNTFKSPDTLKHTISSFFGCSNRCVAEGLLTMFNGRICCEIVCNVCKWQVWIYRLCVALSVFVVMLLLVHVSAMWQCKWNMRFCFVLLWTWIPYIVIFERCDYSGTKRAEPVLVRVTSRKIIVLVVFIIMLSIASLMDCMVMMWAHLKLYK